MMNKIRVSFDNNYFPTEKQFKKFGQKIQFVPSEPLIKEILLSFESKPEMAINKLTLLLKYSERERIVDSLVSIFTKEVSQKKMYKPWFLLCNEEKKLRKSLKTSIQLNNINENYIRKINKDKEESDSWFKDTIKDMKEYGQKIIQEEDKKNWEKGELKLQTPSMNDFNEFIQDWENHIWCILDGIVSNRVGNLSKMPSYIREDTTRYPYSNLLFKVNGYMLFSSLFHRKLNSNINYSVLSDNAYLANLFHVDFFVTDDKYFKEVSKFVFENEKIGKIIDKKEFMDLL